MPGQKREKGQLGAAIAFTERVDGVNFDKEVCSLSGKVSWCQTFEIIRPRQLLENPIKLVCDKFRLAEPVATLTDMVRISPPQS